jgi:hypothetical protein
MKSWLHIGSQDKNARKNAGMAGWKPALRICRGSAVLRLTWVWIRRQTLIGSLAGRRDCAFGRAARSTEVPEDRAHFEKKEFSTGRSI